jgi:putative oxidoreductase
VPRSGYMSAMDANREFDRKTDVALLLGRFGIGAIFLISGLGKVTGWSGTVAYAASKGVPEVLLMGATALELLGAISLVLGLKTRWGAVALIFFLVPVTLVFHDFWAAQGPDVRLQSIQFLKNLAIGGGLVAVLGVGAGALSLDARLARGRGAGVARTARAHA